MVNCLKIHSHLMQLITAVQLISSIKKNPLNHTRDTWESWIKIFQKRSSSSSLWLSYKAFFYHIKHFACVKASNLFHFIVFFKNIFHLIKSLSRAHPQIKDIMFNCEFSCMYDLRLKSAIKIFRAYIFLLIKK